MRRLAWPCHAIPIRQLSTAAHRAAPPSPASMSGSLATTRCEPPPTNWILGRIAAAALTMLSHEDLLSGGSGPPATGHLAPGCSSNQPLGHPSKCQALGAAPSQCNKPSAGG